MGDVALVTGASSGVGREVALDLAKRGYTVVMLCRNLLRGEEALKDIIEKSGNQSVHLMICNLGNISEVRVFAEDFKKRFQQLNILVNNAGVILPSRHTTKEGYEMQFAVNFLGPFLLTQLLLNLLKTSAPARIINVSSGAHKVGKIHFNDLQLEKKYTLFRAYAQSKLAITLFTYELARRLEGTGVTVNCLHPGAVATNMGINRKTGFGKTITKLLKPFFLTPEQGAKTAIYLAVSPEVEKVSGQYFYKEKGVVTSKRSYDVGVAQKLWDVGLKLIE